MARVCNPVLLNGIPSLLARADLADRALAITLPPIPDAARRTEVEMDAAFAAAAPGILALLLDGLVLALRDAPYLRLPRLPRMADFAKLACAAAPAFGWTAADMLAALEENRTNAVAPGDRGRSGRGGSAGLGGGAPPLGRAPRPGCWTR